MGPPGKRTQHFLVTGQCWLPSSLSMLIEATVQGEVPDHGQGCEHSVGSDSPLTTHLQPRRSWKDGQEGRRRGREPKMELLVG